MKTLYTISGYIAVALIAVVLTLLFCGKVKADETLVTEENFKRIYKVAKDKEIKINYNNSNITISEDKIMWVWKKVF